MLALLIAAVAAQAYAPTTTATVTSTPYATVTSTPCATATAVPKTPCATTATATAHETAAPAVQTTPCHSTMPAPTATATLEGYPALETPCETKATRGYEGYALETVAPILSSATQAFSASALVAAIFVLLV